MVKKLIVEGKIPLGSLVKYFPDAFREITENVKINDEATKYKLYNTKTTDDVEIGGSMCMHDSSWGREYDSEMLDQHIIFSDIKSSL